MLAHLQRFFETDPQFLLEKPAGLSPAEIISIVAKCVY
jgi:hypothetical protein